MRQLNWIGKLLVLSVMVCTGVADRLIALPPGWQEQSEALPDSGGTVASVLDCENVSLMSQVLPQQFSTNTTCVANATNVCANDVWAYVSPQGREYAILGLRVGTGFVDVTDPYAPSVVGAITDNNSLWSDMKTYQHYAYNVNESGGGMQIINLANIDPPTRSVSLVGAFTQNGLSTVHTLWINEQSGYAYLCGSNLNSGRLMAVNLANPTSPVIAGSMIQSTYVHAAQVVSYTSGFYAGREIAFCYCGGAGLKIVDVTNKANMFTMSTLAYPNLEYCHQGELTQDWKHIVVDDELDEDSGSVSTTTTYVINVENLSAPFLAATFTNGLPTIDHNQMVRGLQTFQANYTSGLRVYDISDVSNAEEVGHCDTYPFNNGVDFNGAWGVYARLPSGSVLLSDMHGGLFVFDATATVSQPCAAPSPPQARGTITTKNRYLTIVPGNAGELTALRVRLVDLPAPFEGVEGADLWVQRPEQVLDEANPPVLHQVSRLGCNPAYLDWGAVGTLQIADRAVVPNATYAVQAIRPMCNRSMESNYSSAAVAETALMWGDVGGLGETPGPDGSVDGLDISLLVNKFRQTIGAVSLPEADLYPGDPDGLVDGLDIAHAVDAFRLKPYPFAGPTVCP